MKNFTVIMKFMLLLILVSLSVKLCSAKDFKIDIDLDHSDWTYKLGETAMFNVTMSGDWSYPIFVDYEIGPEKMGATINKTFILSDTNFVINGGTMNIPGFLRCRITVTHKGKKLSQIATAGFQPEEIQPTISYPKDFIDFWYNAIAKARAIPLDTEFTLLEDRCTEEYNVYQVSYLNNEFKSRSYGILTIPVKEGEYPAIIRYPGAGVHPMEGNVLIANKNVITLDVYIHPFPMIWEKSFYDNLKASPFIDYKFWGVEDKDTYYYKKSITGCIKAVDLIYSLTMFDGENLASWGSSQGGALSIISAALDKRIKMLVALCPALCDYTGYLHNRAGGYPHFFDKDNIDKYNNEKVLKTLPYYDVVNFARHIEVPGFYTWGFNDEGTPPTSFYSAYNVISAPKKVLVIPEGRHKIYSEQLEKTYSWMFNSFK